MRHRTHEAVRCGAILLLVALGVTGCRYYSFTGASIPARLQTIAIPQALDNTTAPAELQLDEALTDLLIRRFVRQTRLSLAPTENEADAVLTARLERYRNEPTAVTGAESADLNRVSITVSVRYVDRVEEKELINRTFTGTEEYDPLATGLQGEVDAARAALEDIANDIFTATSDW